MAIMDNELFYLLLVLIMVTVALNLFTILHIEKMVMTVFKCKLSSLFVLMRSVE